jgi:hypothetical protein
MTWTPIDTLPLMPGPVTVAWIRLAESLRGATFLTFTATGSWTALPGLLAPCGPDGLTGLALAADRVVLADAPPGALIGRIGGSSAGIKADGAFVIGSNAVVAVPAGSAGPLFIGFNITGRPVDVTAIAVTVSGGTQGP